MKKLVAAPLLLTAAFALAQDAKTTGDRGLYKTTDGGRTWNAMLTIDESTGVTDVVMDPRDPDTLIAAAWQRRRHVLTLIGIHKSTDGGKTWKKITSGLPKEEMGRIGLAIAPTEPHTVYMSAQHCGSACFAPDPRC